MLLLDFQQQNLNMMQKTFGQNISLIKNMGVWKTIWFIT